MGITFAVDDVVPARERLDEQELSLASLAPGGLVACSRPSLTLVTEGAPTTRRFGGPPDDRMHALVQAVDIAHRLHRPLRITPEAVWITLAQGFARHVQLNAEALRARFVRQEARKTVSVTVEDALVGEAWREVLLRFEAALDEEVGPGVTALLARPFSTTDDDARAVFRVVLMEAFKEYFEYEAVAVCGIPEVTLEGTVDDWRDLKVRVAVMREFDLAWWCDALLPVCAEWIATAAGRPSGSFWRAILRPAEVYGGYVITGWLTRLFPYVERDGGWQRNDFRAARRIPEDATKPEGIGASERRVELRRKAIERGIGKEVPWAHAGVSPRELPGSWSRADVTGRGIAEGHTYLVGGGLVGVAQARDGLALEPCVAWFVEESPEHALWPALERRHVTTRLGPDGEGSLPRPVLRGALAAFFRRYTRASLFDGAVVIEGHTLRHRAPEPSDDPYGADKILSLERWVGPAYEHRIWSRHNLWTFARVGAHGALAHVQDRPHSFRLKIVGGPALQDEPVVSEALPHVLDWVVYIPDVRVASVADHVVIALDGWSFFRTLLAHTTPYFLRSDVSLPGRFVDLLRDGTPP